MLLSKSEVEWLKTGRLPDGSVPSRSYESRMRANIRQKMRSLKLDLAVLATTERFDDAELNGLVNEALEGLGVNVASRRVFALTPPGGKPDAAKPSKPFDMFAELNE